ncbi:MAG: hypothetical protein QXK06_04630 [Candidatus Diapherotrites archaeon]
MREARDNILKAINALAWLLISAFIVVFFAWFAVRLAAETMPNAEKLPAGVPVRRQTFEWIADSLLAPILLLIAVLFVIVLIMSLLHFKQFRI